jgi:hypothetical protein
MRTRTIWFVACGIAATWLCQGCCGHRERPYGVDVHYSWQTLRAKVNLPIGVIYAAARQATDELCLRVMRAAEDGISAEIRAVDAQYDTVEIRLGALPWDRTRLCISVGPFGDKAKSLVLFDRIMANVGGAGQVGPVSEVRWDRPPGRDGNR